MKHKLFTLVFACLAFVTLALPTPARADGIIIPPEPPPCPENRPCYLPAPMVQLAIRYHRVTVTIEDQVAVTHVDQVFHNPNDWPVEGIYVFPIPAGAAVSAFTLWVDGEPVAGELLDAEQARRTYQEIVSELRDPALLEYAGQGALRASIFPIPPGGERRIELEYTQALTAENGLVRYIYPLSTEKFSVYPLEEVSIGVEVRSSQPVRALYSPSHPLATSRESDFHLRAGYEDTEVLPDKDFALYYSVGESEAFHLLTYRDPSDLSDPDGFFLLLLAPRPDSPQVAIPKDVLLVLDRSGSMEGEKFRQSQEALRYILKHLNPDDRFNIISFSTGVELYAQSLRPASEAQEALPWVDGLRAEGNTDINRALLEAVSLVDGERPTYLIFLTDGLPTEGVTDSRQILANLEEAAPEEVSLFAFGVGYDVDTFLLDSLVEAHHGSSSYVLPGEPLDEIVSGFYARISTPVMTGLSLDFDDLPVYDIYPQPLPDLFLGSQIIAVGRYRQGGAADLSLSGEVNGEPQVFRYEDQRFTEDSRGESGALANLPRLWATRKIGYLLNRIRLEGPDQETIDQVVHLSIRYGIVTPYTSYLVTEDLPLGEAEQQRIAAEELRSLQAMGTAPASGQAAVQKAADQGSLAGAQAPPAEASSSVRIAGSHTFIYKDGVWLDTAYDPEEMQVQQVAFLSQDYFALAQARPELASAFALGPQVIAVSEGIAYEVVSSGEVVKPVELPPTFTPLPAGEPSPTPAPIKPVRETPSPAPGMLPCASALLVPVPLVIVLVAAQRRARKPVK